MEITASEMYWILMLDGIHILFVIGVVIPILLIVATLFFVPLALDLEFEASVKFIRKVVWRLGVIAIISALAAAFTPSTKQMAMIKVVPAIVNSDIAKEVSGDAKELYKLGVESIKNKLQGK